LGLRLGQPRGVLGRIEAVEQRQGVESSGDDDDRRRGGVPGGFDRLGGTEQVVSQSRCHDGLAGVGAVGIEGLAPDVEPC